MPTTCLLQDNCNTKAAAPGRGPAPISIWAAALLAAAAAAAITAA
jgi:MYXO-CTERM domain-containing protein